MLKFAMYLGNSDKKTIRFDSCYPCFQDSIKKIFPYCPFKALNKFLANPPIRSIL